MSGYVIGYDFGSQAAKAVLCSADGQVLGTANADYPILYPKPTWAEQDPRDWILAFGNITHQVLASAGRRADEVVALGLDAYVDSVVPVDEHLRPLRKAFLWMDRRAVKQCDEIALTLPPARLFEITGLNLDPSHGAAKTLWLRDNEPTVFNQAFKFLLPASYLVAFLTGEFVVDYSNASSTMLLDVTRRRWSTEVLEALHLREDQLAEVKPATQIAGSLRAEAAAQLGLPKGIPVVVGSGDEHAACLGAGVVAPGPVCDIGGTAEPVAAATLKPVFDSTRLVETHCHADSESWLMENPGFVSGANLRWYRDNFAVPEVKAADVASIDPYDLLTLQAQHIPLGSEGLIFLPCLMGAMTPEWNPHARGVLYGLTLHHSRGHIARAIMEASAYGLRDIVDRLAACGVECQEIRAVGGQARSGLWCQIKADVTNMPVTVLATEETASLGAAMLAAVAGGLFRGIREAVEAFVHPLRTLYPDPSAHSRYSQSYALYREIYDRLRPTFETAHDHEQLLARK